MQEENIKQKKPYEVIKKAGEDILYMDFKDISYSANLAENPEIMEKTINAVIENPNISRIIFVQDKNYNYDFKETQYLLELSGIYIFLTKQEKILSHQKLVTNREEFFSNRYNEMLNFLSFFKKDPIFSYYELKKYLIKSKILYDKSSPQLRIDIGNYISLLNNIIERLENTKFFMDVSKYLDSYKKGNRGIYNYLFKPDVIPNFTFTRVISDLPEEGEIVDQYEISLKESDKSTVTIIKRKNQSKYLYYLSPPENFLSEEENLLLNLSRGVLLEHQPKAEEFTDTEKTRTVFFNISKDLLSDLSNAKNLKLDYSNLNKLSRILVRQTIGFGLIEVLLQDKNCQDISLNAPISKNPVFLKHSIYGECETNILPSREDADSWAAKFRMLSGRPLDEANPILDTQLEIEGDLRARIAIIQGPLSPDGLAYSIRRHRESPWTLPLFIENNMINPLGAGLMSFLIDGARTLLIAGTRSSGKTSFLGSLMVEINPKNRIISVEDSLELPIESLRKLHYNVLRMKVRSALLKGTSEVSAEDGIRTSLRLGDSCLIVGEVRSSEAKALYEAMRVGALANVVAGTIHGASPYGVYDRVVNDLEVPKTSFKATDIIVVVNTVKSADGLSSKRRVLQITEVRKFWEEDPLNEGGFVDLMKYNVETDELEPTDALINGDSDVIKDIASNVKGWAGNWDRVYGNILLRAKVKNEILKISKKYHKRDILEAEFNVLSNNMFHQISSEVIHEFGFLENNEVFSRWQKWIEEEAKK